MLCTYPARLSDPSCVHQESAPSCHQQTYGERIYWEDRYFRELRAGTSQYEWYLGYEALRTILRWHVPLQASVLQVGLASALSPSECALLRCCQVAST